MTRTAVRARGNGFDVDFHRLAIESRSALGALRGRLASLLSKRERLTVNPHLISLAVREVMGRCDMWVDAEHRLLWNEYKIFLAEEDYRRLEPLRRHLESRLTTVIEKAVRELRGEPLGDVATHLTIDEEQPVPVGHGYVEPSYRESHEARAEADPATMTVRVAPRGRRSAPTARIEDTAAAAGALTVSWPGGTANVPAGGKLLFGRPHEGAPARFVALTGADRRVSRVHLAIENGRDRTIVTRQPNANPVSVSGKSLQPGGPLDVRQLPATVSLAAGALELTLDRPGRR